ncbi:MAG: energy-coupling factor transporter ATPase [Clostridia bacterium]|nr:energy-coupling factor transporter ATPase [Clostridia bacterium]
MQAIVFDGVSFFYKPSEENELPKLILNDLSLEVEKGAFIALLGKNGSGKSTCAKLINGLLTPTSGTVSVFGLPVNGENTDLFEIRSKVGMVFQNPDNQQIASIVEDDIAFGPENLGVPREEIGRRIDYALKVTDMEKFRYSQVARLSGGQKQRIAIAGALALNPEILILDESTSMLDPKGRREVTEVARNLNREKGMTVIDITHYMDEAAEADEIYVLDDGKLRKKGDPSEIFSDEEMLAETGLELPRASKLAKELRLQGLPLKKGILSKEELLEELCVSLRIK